MIYRSLRAAQAADPQQCELWSRVADKFRIEVSTILFYFVAAAA